MYRILLILLVISSLAVAQELDVTWGQAAQNVCNQIDNAVNFYQQGDLKKARLQAVMAYFKGYDAEIEPAVRITLGGPHVFNIEQEFRRFALEMKPNPDKEQLKRVRETAAALCQMIHEDAKALNANQVKPQVFKVN